MTANKLPSAVSWLLPCHAKFGNLIHPIYFCSAVCVLVPYKKTKTKTKQTCLCQCGDFLLFSFNNPTVLGLMFNFDIERSFVSGTR